MRRSDLLKASPPMFQSRLLDKFTRVHPVVPVLIYAPVIVLMLVLAVGNDGWWDTLGLVLIGYCLWTLFEYWLHRLVFHFEPEEGIGARIHWMIHGVHQAFMVLGGLTVLSTIVFRELKNNDGDSVSQHNGI